MLNKIKQLFIDLIVIAIKDEQITLNLTDNEIDTIIKYASYHSIENIINKALKLTNSNIPKEFEKKCNLLFHKAITQDTELELIKEVLNNNKIYHLPLKGSIIRNYYSSLEYRNMADIDILVKKEDLTLIKKLMLNLGYNQKSDGGNHDVYLKKPFMNIEMHREMIDEEYVYSKYYTDIWNKLNLDNLYTLELSNEDLYIYNIIHAGKHFSEGGTGIRILIDIYYTLNSLPKINMEYIYNELKKINLDTFAKELYNLSNSIFNKEKLNINQELLLDYLIDSGTYGNIVNSSTSGVINNQSKNKFLLKRLFPSFMELKHKYPRLNKYPILLPYYWLKRLLAVLFNKKRRKKYIDGLNNIDQNNINRIKKIKEITRIK